jgi:hypothetical protein
MPTSADQWKLPEVRCTVSEAKDHEKAARQAAPPTFRNEQALRGAPLRSVLVPVVLSSGFGFGTARCPTVASPISDVLFFVCVGRC